MRARPARLLLALATSAAVLGSVATPALAGSAASDVGLFGVQDPTYDGVYRQSLALLALTAVGQTPDDIAVDWLLAQQCADGAFTSYRADTSVACAAKDEDENATALAIQALAALGKPTTTAVAALKRFQLADGGFYQSSAFGTPASDANSTGLAKSAFVAAGVDPATVTSNGKTADDFLRSVQLPCTAATGAGSYDFQPEATLAANDYATVQALLGQLGKAMPVAPATMTASTPACAAPTDAKASADAALGYVAARLTATNGSIPSAFGSGADWTTTANAVLDLAAAGQGAAAAQAGLAALQANAGAYTQVATAGNPGALANLILVAHATGVAPTSFGGIDLVQSLAATERTAAAAPSPSSSPSQDTSSGTTPTATAQPTLPRTGTDGVVPLSIVGSGLLTAGLIALAVRRRRGATSWGPTS